MLKSDEPPGRANPIWFDVFSEFEITYNSLPKTYQPSKFCEEYKFKRALYRLTRRGLVKPVLVAAEGVSLRNPKGCGYAFYSLTKLGRLASEKLYQQKHQQEHILKDQGVFEGALNHLLGLGNLYVTVNQVREVLWQGLLHNFSSRVEFDRYWNNTKTGLMLKKYTVGQRRVGENNREREYRLPNPQFDQNGEVTSPF